MSEDKPEYEVTVDGEVIVTDKQLEELGVQSRFAVTDEGSLSFILHIRHTLQKEIETLTSQMEKMIKQRKNAIQSLDFRFKGQIEETVKTLLPYGKKTYNGLWSDCGFRTIPGGYIIDNEMQLNEWCAGLDDEMKEKCGVKAKEVEYTRDIKKIKALASDENPIPGLIYKSSTEKFYIE